jgi:NAD(P)-dependent dehydrogenase (short-subunit alcohol dehydrogenase family)
LKGRTISHTDEKADPMSLAAECLSGRNAVVVGASSGINLGIAHRLGSLGARIAIISRSQERIEAAADTLRADALDVTPHAGDVRDATAVQAIMTEVADAKGPIDIVVSGAAGNFFVPAAKMSPNAFKTVIDIDLIGTFNVLSAAYPHLRRPGAVLVNITAPQADRAMPMQAHACSAKAGIEMLTRCLALEWGVDGIRVNAVSPGPIADTEGLARLATDAQLAERIRGALALPRFGQRIDIGNAVAWLCSEGASFVTGTTIDCDGGMRLGNLYLPE